MFSSLSDNSPLKNRQQEIIADYLDHICGPLLGNVPREERSAFRAEAEDHLYQLIAEYEESGCSSPEEATALALREYGPPWQTGEAFLEAWQQQTGYLQNGAPWQRQRFYTRYLPSFASFGIGSVITIGICETNLLFPKPKEILLTSASIFVFVFPILAGCAVGYRAYIQPLRTIGMGMLPVLIHSLLTACVMVYHPIFLQLAIVQCLYWLPVGIASAALINAFRQRRIRHTYLQRVRF